MSMSTADNAAYSLEGRVLNGKWKVLKRIDPKPGSTGGFFSVCYHVSDGNQEAFLKALNFKAFFDLFRGKSVVEILNEQTNAFKYEKELLLRCKNNRLSKVSIILDEGEEFVENFTISNVPFLIFEMADGDVRSHMNFSKDVEISWKLRSLHNVALGLMQLHGVRIGHSDLKPSNVLLYESGLTSKIGDLGRSLCADIAAPHENGGNFPGDFSYAPPEFLYGYIVPDWNTRVRATDMYLFGSLVVWKNIDPAFKWDVWTGSFNDVKDYLTDGFYKAIKEFKNSISDPVLSGELSGMLEYCCFPHPENRGHPKAIEQIGNQYDLQRTVSKFDLLASKAEYTFK